MPEELQLTNKPALLAVIHTERARLVALLTGLTEAQLTEPGVVANWSIKDILAHVAAWERLAMDRIAAAQSGATLKYPVISGDEFVDQFNAQTYEKYKDQPLDSVQNEFHNAHRDFIAQIEALDESKLGERLNFNWSGKTTYQVMISANTHWHYPEHAEAIEHWLENQV